MPTIPCDQKLACECSDYPVANYSAEDPDHRIFIGLDFDGGDPPPLGQEWTSSYCIGICRSLISQEEADACAARMATQFCISQPPTPPDPPVRPNQTWFFNIPTSCDSTCPDGSPFRYTVPAGWFVATSQYQANAMAGSLACLRARQRRVCLGPLSPTECCINQPYSAILTATGATLSNAPVNVWKLVGGSFPEGVGLHDGFQTAFGGKSMDLSGTPTEGGQFTFTIRVTGPAGDFMEKTYTLCVIKIQPDTLADGTIGVAYFQLLTAPLCAATPESWQVTSGALPAGLALDEATGIISGVPTTPGTSNFTITFQSAST